MATVEGNVEALSQAIMAEARAESDQIAGRARSEAESIRERARRAAMREKQAILDDAAQQARRMRGQAVANSQMKARSLELEHREQLLEKVFAAVAERLPAVTRQKDYASVAEKLVREALSQLNASSVELEVDKATRDILSEAVLQRISKDTGVQINIGKTLTARAGVLARSADGRLQFDNTLETRLSRIQAPIRAAVYRVLMGEAE